MEWESCSAGDKEEDYEDTTDNITDDEASSSSHFQNSHADSSDVNSLLSGADPATDVIIREGRMQQDKGTHRFIENYDDEERNEQTCSALQPTSSANIRIFCSQQRTLHHHLETRP
jgi:hypothetical protein